MIPALFDKSGNRKYLVVSETLAFVHAALKRDQTVSSFCLTMAFTGARISEVLALNATRIDAANGAIIFETLKRRKRNVYRAVPIPSALVSILVARGANNHERLWAWGRTTAWKIVKEVMHEANIADGVCKPKALRHGFAIEAGQKGVPLNVVQRWMGHSRLETTAIYAGALGEEERNLARRAWSSIETAIDHGALANRVGI